MNILLLDTCDDLLNDLKCYLELYGHNCTTVTNPLNALSLIHLECFDIMISEFFANDENYESSFIEIRKNKLPTKIIILTAVDYKISELKTLYDLGITAIFQKPVEPKLLLDTITEFEKKYTIIQKSR